MHEQRTAPETKIRDVERDVTNVRCKRPMLQDPVLRTRHVRSFEL